MRTCTQRRRRDSNPQQWKLDAEILPTEPPGDLLFISAFGKLDTSRQSRVVVLFLNYFLNLKLSYSQIGKNRENWDMKGSQGSYIMLKDGNTKSGAVVASCQRSRSADQAEIFVRSLVISYKKSLIK